MKPPEPYRGFLISKCYTVLLQRLTSETLDEKNIIFIHDKYYLKIDIQQKDPGKLLMYNKLLMYYTITLQTFLNDRFEKMNNPSHRNSQSFYTFTIVMIGFALSVASQAQTYNASLEHFNRLQSYQTVDDLFSQYFL